MGATGGRAKPLSNDYYPAESQTLCFKDSVINNCAVFGCPADSTDTNANRDCWGDVYAEYVIAGRGSGNAQLIAIRGTVCHQQYCMLTTEGS